MSEITSLKIQKQQNLKPYNTLGVEATASRFVSVKSQDQLIELLREPVVQSMQKVILGGGSNVLFADDVDGLVLHMGIKGISMVKEDDDHVWIRSGAGESWHQLVLYCVERGWGGIENLSLIPGTVGAAPIQNIGAYGVELQEVFESLEAVEVETGNVQTFDAAACEFGYRDSIFKNKLKGKYIVTQVTLRLSKDPELNTSYGAIQSKLEENNIQHPTIKDISDVVIAIRQSKLPDPKLLGNAGSFFKNPAVSTATFEQLRASHPEVPGYPLDDGSVKVPAGWLIEEAGWKGKVLGNAGTYRNQALVIVNHGGATGREILALAHSVQQAVKQQFDIELDPEVNIIL